jgi:hypothetical protein
MKLHLLIPVTALLITVSANATADAERLDPARPGAGSGDHSQPGSTADPGVSGGSYRGQAPPHYRIEQGSGGSTNAFPRVPGTSYRDYSRPGYNARQ